MEKEKISLECSLCGNKFKVVRTQSDRRSFCSQKCYSEHISDNPEKFNLFEEGHDGYDSSPWQGKNLSESHKQNISKGLEGLSRSEEYIEENLLGDNHWNWQGGKSYEEYPSTFNPNLKRQVRKSNCFRCGNCGRIQADNVDEHGKRLEVHHLDEDKENNLEDNLVPLCTKCHSRHHNSDNFRLDIP